MARVANCPQCQHELIVPDATNAEAWAKCPECRAFFQVKQAAGREVGSALLVEPEEAASAAPIASEEMSSAPAGSHTVDEELTAPASGDFSIDELRAQSSSGEELEAAAQRIDEWFRSNRTVPDAPPAPTDSAVKFDDMPEEADSKDELESKEEVTVDTPPEDATVDYRSSEFGYVDTTHDFELEDHLAPKSHSTWNDANDVDDLLGDLEPSPLGEAEAVPEEEPSFAATDDPVAERAEAASPAERNEAPEIVETNREPQRRRRSPVRMLAMVAVAGVFGLALGYYALLWLRGPEMDFLQVAEHLPAAALPASFQQKPVMPTTPPADVVADSESAPPPSEPREFELAQDEAMEATPLNESAAFAEEAAASPPESLESSAEMQASYDETDPPAASTAPLVGDRYAATSEADAVAAPAAAVEEPASLDTATELALAADFSATEEVPSDAMAAEPSEELDAPTSVAADLAEPAAAEPIHMTGTPSFTNEQLQTSLTVAADAQPKLVAGNFADGKEVQQAKGFAFAMLADLAQKVTFVEPKSAALQEQAYKLFHNTLADAHTRGEVAQILPRWIASPNRKHGGVFFAGEVTRVGNAGPVIENEVRLNGGQTITVLAPAGEVEPTSSGRTVAVVGWLLEAPKSQVAGYTGDASQAVWSDQLIPLQ